MIYLSVGHSGNKVGAVANGTTEFQECAKIADAVVKQANSSIVLVPTTLDILPRIKWINEHAKESDVLIELHMDSASPTARGATVFYYAGSEVGQREGQRIGKLYSDATGIKLRGVLGDTNTRHGRLGIVRDTKPLAFLVELGFISNVDDLALVREKAAKGVLAMFDSHKTEEAPQDRIADWALDAFSRAQKKGFTSQNPLDVVGTARLRACLVKAGFSITDNQQPVTYQELIVVLDRAGRFNP